LKIFVLYIIICLYVKKSQIKTPESLGGHFTKEIGGKWERGREGGGGEALHGHNIN